MPLEPQPTVLIVDDDPLVLASTARFLRRAGFRTVCSDSPFGVSALILKEQPSIVVLDFHMPGLDGQHLVRLLRTSARTQATRVIFYSGVGEEELRAIAVTNGASYALKSRGGNGLREVITRTMALG
jgi:two-component system NtrC family sensor kinase